MVHGHFIVANASQCPPKLQNPKSLNQSPRHDSFAFPSQNQNPISQVNFIVRAAASAPPLGGDYSGKLVLLIMEFMSLYLMKLIIMLWSSEVILEFY